MKNIKTIYLGDSIVAYDGKPYTCTNEFGGPSSTEICRGYPTLLNERLGLVNIGNYAVGGHTILDQRNIILNLDFTEADLVIFSVGVNDFSKSVPIGKIPDMANPVFDDTFYGAYAQCLEHILKSNPKIKVILMTPLHRNTLHRNKNGATNISDTVINGNTLFDFADAIINLGRIYSCPVADMMSKSGLNKMNSKIFTFEGVHPNNDGYEFIIPTLINTVKSIF